MPINQRNAGFISATYQPLQVANAPTIGAATEGDTSASVAFTAPANVGGSAISAYYAVSNPDRVTVSGASSPINVTGLTNGTAYTFSVWALNTYGPSPFSAASNSVTPAVPQLALFGGGETSSGTINVISRITITTLGNATDFGDLITVTRFAASCSSSTRGIWAGGNVPTFKTNVIQRVTIATSGNALDFGDLIEVDGQSETSRAAGAGNETRGLICGGNIGANNRNVIQYITIATTGNATFFGNLINDGGEDCAACSSSTRAVILSSNSNIMEYVTIASTGNALDFGDISVNYKNSAAGASNSTRGLFAGGQVGGELNTIEYITIATTGNSLDFGDLTVGRSLLAGTAGPTRAVFGGGFTTYASVRSNIIDYVTIASTGNAVDFGDLTISVAGVSACSNCHGGIS